VVHRARDPAPNGSRDVDAQPGIDGARCPGLYRPRRAMWGLSDPGRLPVYFLAASLRSDAPTR
jgi:hypothetical protein